MSPAAAADRTAPRTHLERGRCINCDKPFAVKVRTGIYVKCPKCGGLNPGGVMRDALNKAAIRQRPAAIDSPKPGKRGAPGPPPASPPPSPPRPRKPTVSAAPQLTPPNPAPASQPTSQPPAPAKGRPGLFARIMGSDE